MDHSTSQQLLNFDIDRYINPFVPRNRLYVFPRPIQHFLGYRKTTPTEPPVVVQWVLTFIATLAGLYLVGGIYSFAPGITKWNPPAMIASFGASAVLDYNSIKSPLAQPRNTIIGQTLSAIVGVGISKLFQMAPAFFAEYEWVAGGIGCACASLVMSMTNTIYPPGGATAVLASTNSQVIALGWMLVPLALLGNTLMMAVACLMNNTLRQYPGYWWTPLDVGGKSPSADREKEMEEGDLEEAKVSKETSMTDSERTLHPEITGSVEVVDGTEGIQIAPYRIQVPSHVYVSPEEIALLQKLGSRMRGQAVDGFN